MPSTSLKYGPYTDHFLQLAIWGAGTGILQLILIFKQRGRGSEILAPVDVNFISFQMTLVLSKFDYEFCCRET